MTEKTLSREEKKVGVERSAPIFFAFLGEKVGFLAHGWWAKGGQRVGQRGKNGLKGKEMVKSKNEVMGQKGLLAHPWPSKKGLGGPRFLALTCGNTVFGPLGPPFFNLYERKYIYNTIYKTF